MTDKPLVNGNTQDYFSCADVVITGDTSLDDFSFSNEAQSRCPNDPRGQQTGSGQSNEDSGSDHGDEEAPAGSEVDNDSESSGGGSNTSK